MNSISLEGEIEKEREGDEMIERHMKRKVQRERHKQRKRAETQRQ